MSSISAGKGIGQRDLSSATKRCKEGWFDLETEKAFVWSE